MELLKLEAVYMDKIWGGSRLLRDFGIAEATEVTGEMWAISAHAAGDCQLKGAYAGQRLSELYASRRDLFGNIKDPVFPLLVKIIDAADDLSIQVHPDDAYAATHEQSLGKRECWYVLDAEPGATIVVGQKCASKAEFEEALSRGAWSDILNEIPVKKGDFFQIEPGCVHAIKAGTLILESQQSSDITYRVYDYDRKDAAGKLRELHLDKALDVIDFSLPAGTSYHPEPQPNRLQSLVKTPNYEVERLVLDGEVSFEQAWPFLNVSVISGECEILGEKLATFEHAIVTSGPGTVTLSGTAELIFSHLP